MAYKYESEHGGTPPVTRDEHDHLQLIVTNGEDVNRGVH